MADDLPPSRSSDYRAARIGAAVALTGVVVFVIVFDAVSTDYEVNPVVFVTLVATILTLLGLEAGSIIRGK